MKLTNCIIFFLGVLKGNIELIYTSHLYVHLWHSKNELGFYTELKKPSRIFRLVVLVLDWGLGSRRQQPTLNLLFFFLNSVTEALERAGEEKTILLNKVQFWFLITMLLLSVCY